MKKYKIGLGTCGGRPISTSIINAHDEREAVIKYLESEKKEVTEELINAYLPKTYEHISKKQKKVEVKPRTRASIKQLEHICEEVVDIEEGLMYGTILFRYDNLMSAMKPGHPMEILDSLLAKIYMTIMSGKEPPMEKLEEAVKDFRAFKKTFEVKELKKPIDELSLYVKERQLYLKSK